MPLYEYECDDCGQRFEMIQRFSDPRIEICAKCGKGPVHRLLSSPAIQFKGSGWYITDYSQKGKPEAGASPGSSDGSVKTEKSESKSDATSEGKSETKSDAAASSASTPPAAKG